MRGKRPAWYIVSVVSFVPQAEAGEEKQNCHRYIFLINVHLKAGAILVKLKPFTSVSGLFYLLMMK